MRRYRATNYGKFSTSFIAPADSVQLVLQETYVNASDKITLIDEIKLEFAPSSDTTSPTAPAVLAGSAQFPTVVHLRREDEADNEGGYTLERETGVSETLVQIASIPMK